MTEAEFLAALPVAVSRSTYRKSMRRVLVERGEACRYEHGGRVFWTLTPNLAAWRRYMADRAATGASATKRRYRAEDVAKFEQGEVTP
jgi:hypothetical protein